MNLLIYYNPNQRNFYVVYTNFMPLDKYVGYENSYGHFIIQILAFYNKKYFSVSNRSDFCKIISKNRNLKTSIINKLIRWLYKLQG